jgi:hypothetical protein
VDSIVNTIGFICNNSNNLINKTYSVQDDIISRTISSYPNNDTLFILGIVNGIVVIRLDH